MTAPNDPALQVKVTSFAYCNGAPLALPSFALSAGEIVVLSGRSGSGKSTLLHLVTGVLALDPSQGSVRIVGSELAGLAQTERDRLRPYTIGWMPQRVHLISALSVFENAMLAIRVTASQKGNANDPLTLRAKTLMQEAGVDQLANASPSNISVGQASRVCAVRALVANPRVLCADEPSAALDRDSAEAIAQMLARYANEGGAALIASHDHAFVESLSRFSGNVRTLSLYAP